MTDRKQQCNGGNPCEGDGVKIRERTDTPKREVRGTSEGLIRHDDPFVDWVLSPMTA
ncbi:hypothetical protein HQ544_00355 [Candidatus Falkowbacteria bacterium]|nr:hypothetical protein [Candidatus Falkowbacteria bacterium]